MMGMDFIDCFDGDCTNTAACDGFYLGNDASWLKPNPQPFLNFRYHLDYQSPNNATNNLSRIAIGDLDRDGIPEIFIAESKSKSHFSFKWR